MRNILFIDLARFALASWVIGVVLTLACLASGESPSSPPKGFRTFTWGTAPSRDLKKTANLPEDVTMFGPAALKKPAPLFDIPVAEEAYLFSRGKFYQGQAWLDGKDNFEKMKATLTKQFGSPTFSSESGDLLKWKWPNSLVEVHLYYYFTRATVTFVNNRY